MLFLWANDCSGTPTANNPNTDNGTCDGSETTTKGCTLQCKQGYSFTGNNLNVTCGTDGNYAKADGDCTGKR